MGKQEKREKELKELKEQEKDTVASDSRKHGPEGWLMEIRVTWMDIVSNNSVLSIGK